MMPLFLLLRFRADDYVKSKWGSLFYKCTLRRHRLSPFLMYITIYTVLYYPIISANSTPDRTATNCSWIKLIEREGLI